MESTKTQLEEKWQKSLNEIILDVQSTGKSFYIDPKYAQSSIADLISGILELILQPFGYQTQKSILIKEGALYSQLIDIDGKVLLKDAYIREQAIRSIRNSITAHEQNRKSFPFIHTKNRTQEFLKDKLITAIENLPEKKIIAEIDFDEAMARQITEFTYEELDMLSYEDKEPFWQFLTDRKMDRKVNIASELHVFTKLIDRLDHHTNEKYKFVKRSKETVTLDEEQTKKSSLTNFTHRRKSINEKSIRDSISKYKSKDKPVFTQIEEFLKNLFDK